MVFCDGPVAVGAVAADAPPATAKEIPAAPSTGNLVFVRFRLEGCFACAIVTPSAWSEPASIANSGPFASRPSCRRWVGRASLVGPDFVATTSALH